MEQAEEQDRRGFDLLLKELVSLQGDAKGSDRSRFDRVLRELMTEREKSAVAAERAAVAADRLKQQEENALMLAKQHKEFQRERQIHQKMQNDMVLMLQKQQEELEELASKETFFKEVIQQLRDEVKTLRQTPSKAFEHLLSSDHVENFAAEESAFKDDYARNDAAESVEVETEELVMEEPEELEMEVEDVVKSGDGGNFSVHWSLGGRLATDDKVVPVPDSEDQLGEKIVKGSASSILKIRQEQWVNLAEEVLAMRSNNHRSNYVHVKRIFKEREELVRELMERCPSFREILAFVLEHRFGFRVRKVDDRLEIAHWGQEECKRVGCSLATFSRKRKTSDVAVAAWRLQYPALNVLFEEVEGFEAFMLVIANNTLRNSVYGMVLRVSVGAFLSILDATTDIYVVATYYSSEKLISQADAMLAMILANLSLQVVYIYFFQYRKKSWRVKLREAAISLFFLRPAIDAYRVSTNYKDVDTTLDPLFEMIYNKCFELACEAIPGCVFQIYVWIAFPQQVVRLALLSIAISALTTGYSSAMISFDIDIDVKKRKNCPSFYGYIPDDNGLRTRTFVLMTLISALHNLSRSVGCALLVVVGGGRLLMSFVGSEMGFFFLWKIARREFLISPRNDSKRSKAILSTLARIVYQIIAGFTGCFHFRHPFVLGGFYYSMSMLWAQVFPFVALHLYNNSDGLADSTNDHDDLGEKVQLLLICSFVVWLMLNVAFFCTIDLSYIFTFFSIETGPTCVVRRFEEEGAKDFQKFDVIFDTNLNYSEELSEIEGIFPLRGHISPDSGGIFPPFFF